VYYATVAKHDKCQIVLKRAYFTTVLDGAFCLGRACYKQTRDKTRFCQAWLEWDYGQL